MPEWTTDGSLSATALSEQVANLAQMNELLQENFAQLERMYLEDAGWSLLGRQEEEFSPRGRRRIRGQARFMCATNPMLKRGLSLRVGYVWGQGVTVSVEDSGADGTQDVNKIITDFWDDKSNRRTFTGTQANDKNERKLGTDGELFIALPTNPVTGRVQIRSIDPDEIDQAIHDPQDKDTPWYYLRCFTQRDPFTGKTEPMNLAYPALGFWPASRPKQLQVGQTVYTVRWDAPMRAVMVNEHRGRGLGDAIPALPWAKAHKEFLEDWALLTKALSRIAWRVTGRGDRVQKAARTVAQPKPSVAGVIDGNPRGAGATIGMTTDTTLEAVPKTGATIDSKSSEPLQVMIAAALDVPLTMLTGDPGTTGARAVAQTLDQPTEDAMGLRRRMWAAVIEDICGYVIDQAVLAPAGPLKGSVVRDGDQLVVTLPPADSRIIRVDWPEWDSLPINTLMDAITKADATEKVPPLLIFRWIATAFGVEDVDEWVDKLTDDNGNWVPPDLADEQARAAAANDGSYNPYGGSPYPANPSQQQDSADDTEAGGVQP